MLRDGGRMVAVGIAPAGMRAPIEITRVVRRESSGRRVVRGTGSQRRPTTALSHRKRDFSSPTESVTRRYALEEAPEAYEALDRREIVGRAIVTTG